MATASELQQLYVAYFGRPADPSGLDYWVNTGISTQTFAARMFAQPEFQSVNSGLSVEAQVNQLYLNLFGRSADTLGLLYWTQQINTGRLQLASIANDLIYAAKNSGAASEPDRATLTNKTSAAVAYTAGLRSSVSSILAYQPQSTNPWVSGSKFASAVSFMNTVTATNIPTPAQISASLTTVTTTGVVGQTFTLTANTDNITGGASDDSISGSSSTFNSDDMINGGAGNDILSISASGAATVIANVSNVETIRVTQGGANNTDYALNMIGSTGATELVSRLSTGEVSFDNVQAAAKITAIGTQANSKVTAGFLNSLASGTADSVSLKVDGGANTTFQVSGTDDTQEFETVNLESAGSTKNTVAAIKDAAGNATAALKTLNVTGAGELAITLSGGATAATYNGSAATGVQTVTVGGNFTTIKTGSANDKIDASAGGFFGNTDPKVVNGGDGTDTLVIAEDIANLTSNDADVPHAVSGIEIVEVQAKLADGATLDLTRAYAADKIAGVSTILVTAENNDGTAGGVGGEDVTVNLTGVTTEKVQFSFKATATATNDEAISVKMKDDTGTADAVTIQSVSASATQVNSVTTLTVDRAAGNAANAVETVNLIATAANVGATVGTTITALNAQYSNTLNISGAGNITIGEVELADPTGDTTALIDASALTGKLTLSTGFKTTGADTVTVKLGSGTNSVDFGTEALSADKVVGSTGTDTVKLKEAATDVEMTISDVDTVTVTGAGATKVISAKNFTNVGTINIVDAAVGDNASDNVKVTNIAAGQAVVINSDDATQADWDGDTVTLDLATGVTALAVTLKGDTALEGTGILATDATTLTVTDSIKDADNYYKTQTLVVEGLSSTAKLGTLNLVGGGASSSTATATFTVSGTTNVDVSKVDATALNSNLNISGLTTAAGVSVLLGTGDNSVTLALADLARDAAVVNGGTGTDTVVAASLNDATYRLGSVAVETLALSINNTTTGAVVIDGSDSGDVTKVELTIDAAAATDENVTIQNFAKLATVTAAGTFGSGAGDTVAIDDTAALTVISADTVSFTNGGLSAADATSLTVKLGSSAADADTAEITATVLTAAKATAITLGGSDTTAAGVAYVGKIDVPTLSAAELTSLTLNLDQGDIDLDTVTAAKLATVTVTGDNDLVFGTTGATTTALATFNGSAVTGNITIGQSVDFTTSATVTLGSGADTITLDILTEGGLTVAAGDKATTDVTDTLALAGINNMGTTVIDLSANDQLISLNGSVNAAVQSAFESVNLAGLTGSFGANITGSSEDNTIVGTANADNIVAGEGIDSITGGAGVDTIDLTESTAKADTVALTSALTADRDIITGFGIANDVIALDESAFASINFANTGAVAALAAGDYNEVAVNGALVADKVNVITTAAGYANYATAYAAFAGGGAKGAANEVFVVFYNSTSGKTEIYFDADATDNIGVLVAQIDIVGADVASLSQANFAVF